MLKRFLKMPFELFLKNPLSMSTKIINNLSFVGNSSAVAFAIIGKIKVRKICGDR